MTFNGDNSVSNTSTNLHFNQLLTTHSAALSRRQFLTGSALFSMLSFVDVKTVFAKNHDGSKASLGSSVVSQLNFSSTPFSLADSVTVADGYSYDVLYKLGDPIHPGFGPYKNDGSELAAEFDYRSGDHHDGMHFFGIDEHGRFAPNRSDRGLLVINHEALTTMFLHPENAPSGSVKGQKGQSFLGSITSGLDAKRSVRNEVDKEIKCQGVSVIEIRRKKGRGGKYELITTSSFNRRITAETSIDIYGPARGHALLRTPYSPSGTATRGTLNNCASGYTPWGTYLTCEENWAGYFRNENDLGRSESDKAALRRYAIPASTPGREYWASADETNLTGQPYSRWNITAKASAPLDDYRNVHNTFGYIVEIDPFDPHSTPRKRTALGRFNHEGAWPSIATEGKPLVWYMGCDAQNEYIYKFVSTAVWDTKDIGKGLAAGNKYMDSGTLYVAKFKSDFSGQWVPLAQFANGTQLVGSGTTSNTFEFTSDVDVWVHTRLAADKAGATKMDRPEWGAVNPQNGQVYFTLTNNASRSVARTDAANPRSYEDKLGSGVYSNPNGHIIRWREADDEASSNSFTWDIYAFGAEDDDLNNNNVNLSGLNGSQLFSSPDGLWFSRATGILWIQTDDSAFTDKTNCMLLAAIPGRVGDGSVKVVEYDQRRVTTQVGQIGQLQRFLVGPKDCEITGVAESPDGKVLFVNIQHPGETTSLEQFNSRAYLSYWPYFDKKRQYGNSDEQSPRQRPRSATIAIYRNDGGVIGGNF
jgi:hypothetical protein